MNTPEKNAKLITLLKSKVQNLIEAAELDRGDAVVDLGAEHLKEFCNILKLDSDLQFNLFVSVTAIDWMDTEAARERFQVIYHLMSTITGLRLRIRCWVSEDKPQIATVSDLWSGANFMERECFDMYGIQFEGHPDLRRILMYDEFQGYPLRKDYPVQGKQPRIPLRHPEVRNTAVDMHRPELVHISPRKNASVGGQA